MTGFPGRNLVWAMDWVLCCNKVFHVTIKKQSGEGFLCLDERFYVATVCWPSPDGFFRDRGTLCGDRVGQRKREFLSRQS